MPYSKTGTFAVALLALALAGCQSGRFSNQPASSTPAPLTPAPTGQVTGSQLPPPSAPDQNSFPAAPGQDGTTDVAALDPNLSASAPEITAGSVAGVWSVSVAGQNCRVATPQTKFGQGYRAGPLRCPAPLDGVKSWNVSGNQLAFYDENGDLLATLHSTGQERFSGQTTSGTAVSLSR
ncbi:MULTISPECIES: AprI/Inh family metalloprotease inhibitor [Phyllobacteriaceae]|uniref:AprI/Inh family metalloprotease inhibitor n=1 Tax=Phyllobacteriaceae TaxID=69277 RepID=UPI002ACA19AA|nr:AprI/Inh family metalloprotease inhibitor [Chelativorans sp. M5D2P16]MDZ5699250.1 AprI/Inh family metalloprotease inhibitor [Chelativorans sp. M5D2P16]